MLDLIKKYLSEGFIYAVASSPLKNTDEGALDALKLKDCSKLKIKPVILRKERLFQVTRTIGPKEFHENLDLDAAAKLLFSIAGHPFKNVEAVNGGDKLSLMANKKGDVTAKEHKGSQKNTVNTSAKETADPINWSAPDMSHNKIKQYLLKEGEPLPFLVELGVMTKEGKVVASKYDKFKQINRYLEFIDDIIPALPKGRTVNIVDFGCG